jgi:hypothetical protein
VAEESCQSTSVIITIEFPDRQSEKLGGDRGIFERVPARLGPYELEAHVKEARIQQFEHLAGLSIGQVQRESGALLRLDAIENGARQRGEAGGAIVGVQLCLGDDGGAEQVGVSCCADESGRAALLTQQILEVRTANTQMRLLTPASG